MTAFTLSTVRQGPAGNGKIILAWRCDILFGTVDVGLTKYMRPYGPNLPGVVTTVGSILRIAEILSPASGTMRGLRLEFQGTSFSNCDSVTFALQTEGIDTGAGFTVPAGSTATFVDSVNTSAVTAGQKVRLKVTALNQLAAPVRVGVNNHLVCYAEIAS